MKKTNPSGQRKALTGQNPTRTVTVTYSREKV